MGLKAVETSSKVLNKAVKPLLRSWKVRQWMNPLDSLEGHTDLWTLYRSVSILSNDMVRLFQSVVTLRDESSDP